MGLPSDQQLEEFAEFVKSHRDWSNQDYAEHFDRALSTIENWKHGCYQQGLLQKGNQRPVTRYEGDGLSNIDQMIEERRQQAPRGSNEVETSGTIKVGIGDWHLSDEDVMFRSLESTIDNLIDLLSNQNYESLTFLNIGDTVSGAGIFYGQEYRNITSKSHWQTILATYYLKELTDRIKDETSIDKIHFDVVKGNHDVSNKGTNLAYYLVRDMQAYGLSAKYRGNYHISDNIYMVHGYGKSSYRPQSPTFLRDMSNRVANLNEQGEKINRVLSGHCHWLDVDFQYSLSLSFDIVGGYQRNARQELGRLQRPAGFILYLPNQSPQKIQPDIDVFYEEANDEELEFKNVSRVGTLLKKAYEHEEFHTK